MHRRVFAVAPLLFGSGLCALVYQTVWLREFRLIFGASTSATAAVLGIFMGGLGIGSLLFGNRAEKAPNPLRFYANLEFLIAASAAATPFLVTLVRYLYSAFGGSQVLGPGMGTLVRLSLAVLVLAMPTVLMGGTLPAAARAVVGANDVGRRSLAMLYGVNTLGAVSGALLATFVSLEALGNRRTLWAACLANIVVALIARLLARSATALPGPGPQTSVARENYSPAPRAFVLTAAAVVGFAFLLMELIWYRMLSPLLGGSTFTFGLILGVALFGIGIGGALYALLGQRGGGTLSAFAWTCALEALTLAVPFALGDRIAVLAAHLHSLSTVGFSAHVFGWFLVIAIVVLPSAIVAGFQFPLLVALLGRGGDGVASHTARAYALNTAGAIAGSLAGGFGLMPLFTAPGLWKMVTLLLAGLAFAALALQHSRRPFRALSAGGVLGTAGAAALLLLCLGPTAAWRHSGVGVGRSRLAVEGRNVLLDRLAQFRQQLIWEADGVESSVGISATHGASFVVNGKSDGNIRADAGTQVMGGLIGAALKPDVKNACVIGLGTGSTAGWLAAVPEIQHVDVMELEPAILEMARVCEVGNLHVLSNPKCRVILGDARELLMTTRDRYDLIFSEPSNPYRAGIASLFTNEFYQTARSRLNSGGLFLQWVQAYEVEGTAVRMILATLGNVFPEVEVWTTQAGDLLLVASMEPRQWNAETLSARLKTEPFRTATRRIWGVNSVEGFLAHFSAGPELTRRIAALPEAERNTDDNTLLEFAFARSVGRGDGFRKAELARAAENVGAARPNIVGQVDWDRVEEERVSAILNEGGVAETPTTLSESARVRCDIRRLVESNNAAAAGRMILERKPAPLNHSDLLTFGEALADAGSPYAMACIERLRETDAGDAATLEALLRVRQGKTDEAARLLLTAYSAYRSDPWPKPRVQLRAFLLSREVAIAHPELSDAFIDALRSGPFPGYLMETLRREALVALELNRWRYGAPATAYGYAILEPWGRWTREYLENRCLFYQRTGLGDASRALNELEQFLAADTTPFDQGLKEPASPNVVSSSGAAFVR